MAFRSLAAPSSPKALWDRSSRVMAGLCRNALAMTLAPAVHTPPRCGADHKTGLCRSPGSHRSAGQTGAQPAQNFRRLAHDRRSPCHTLSTCPTPSRPFPNGTQIKENETQLEQPEHLRGVTRLLAPGPQIMQMGVNFPQNGVDFPIKKKWCKPREIV